MTDDREKNNQLAKAKTSSLQKTSSNIVSRGLSDLALLDVEEAKSTPDDVNEMLFDLGYLYHTRKEYDKAIETYTDVISSNQNHEKAYNNRGLAYYYKGQYDRAIEDYNKAITLNPNDAIAYTYRGLAYAGKKQYNRAIEDYSKAIALNPNDIAAYYNRGMIYFHEIGNMDKAIENFDKLIELEPNDAEAYLYRGFAYNHKGDVNRSIADFKKACDLGDKDGCENLQRLLRES